MRGRGDRSGWLLGVALVLAGAGAVLATRALVSRPPGAIDARANPFPPTEAALAAGGRVYRAHCQACHGIDGHGDGPEATGLFPPPVDFWTHFGSGHTHPDGRLYFWIASGIPGTGMPAFGTTLSEAERWQVIDYIKTFIPVDR